MTLGATRNGEAFCYICSMSKKECPVMKDLMSKLTPEQRRKYKQLHKQLPREEAIELGPEFPGVLFVRRVRNG